MQPRKRSEQALVAVVQQAYVCGVSTRRVDQLVESLGLRISRSEVSRICAGSLTSRSRRFASGRWRAATRICSLDAKVEKVRDGGRIARKCVVVAHAVHESGRREIIGLDVGEAETEAFWREFLRSPGRARPGRGAARDQRRPPRAEGRDRAGPRRAVAALHRALPAGLPRSLSAAISTTRSATVIRQIFNAANGSEARRRLRDAVGQLERRLPKVAALLEDAEPDVLAFYAFPSEHWPKLRSTNPLERFNREIGRSDRRRRHLPRRRLSDPPRRRCSPSKPTTNGSSAAATSAASRWLLSTKSPTETPPALEIEDGEGVSDLIAA